MGRLTLSHREWVFTIRLKQAREQMNLSQRRLGILMGINVDSASSRINQYEHGKHEPDFGTVKRMAKVLKVPTAYFYAENDVLAELILRLEPLSESTKRRVLRALHRLAAG
jgi:transcriptional regulator with XRE-family HTH domain